MMDVFEQEFYTFLETHKDEPNAEFFITIPPNTFVQDKDKVCHLMISQDQRYAVTYPEDKEQVTYAIR